MARNRQKSFLIIRLGALGDLVVSTPVAAAIRGRYPDARITWVVSPRYVSLLEGHPEIDRIIVWDRKEWRRLFRSGRWLSLWQSIRKVRRELREWHYDFAFDLHGLFKTSYLTWLSGARHRVGLGSREGGHLLMTKTISRNLGDHTQIGSEYRYLVNQLGMPDSPWQMYIPRTNAARKAADNLLTNNAVDPPEDYAVICPFSTKRQKHWPEEYWQQLVLRIRGRHNMKTLILGSEEDGDAAARIARASGAINLAGQTSINSASEIISRARILLGVDTGMTHIGLALRVPTIALFGPTQPYAFTGQNINRVIHLDLPCSPCGNHPTCGGSFDCMKGISPDVVLSQIKPLLKAGAEGKKNVA